MLSEDEFSKDGHTSHDRSRKEGSMFPERCGPSLLHYRLALLCLGLLNVILLLAATVIGVYCGKVNEGYIPLHQNATELRSQLKDLQATHSKAIKDQEEAQRALQREVDSQQQQKLLIEQQKTINDGLQRQIESLRAERTPLKSNLSDIQQSCGRCLPGWVLLNTSCYFYADSEVFPKKNWPDSRADCISRGADMVVIDNWEEQERLFEYLPKVDSGDGVWWLIGIWIGIRDIQTEGTWVWINNVTLQNEGYWKDGEPNDNDRGEDCVAIFNRGRPRRTWFDINCETYENEWLCEMNPK